MTASYRFPRQARVRAKADFDRIFKHGRRVALPVLALHWLDEEAAPVANDASAPPLQAVATGNVDTPGGIAVTAGTAAGPRLGLAVSRKVDPRAVGRNRIKRCLRDWFRRHRHQLAPAAYVVVARPGARELSTDQLVGALTSLLRRAAVLAPAALPLPPPAGTMPAADRASRGSTASS